MFKIVKKGYDPEQVEDFVAKLKKDYEEHLALQKKRIFELKNELEKVSAPRDTELVHSLVVAVENAKQIESSSKNIYELETKKLGLIYSKMEKLVSEENLSNVRGTLLKLIQDCKLSLQNNIDEKTRNLSQTQVDDPIKKLLDKMMSKDKSQSFETQKEAKFAEIKLSPIAKQQQSSVQSKPQQKKASDDDQNSAEDASIQEVPAFDFKEALNPKQDLSEIMKAFDFYNDKNSNEGA